MVYWDLRNAKRPVAVLKEPSASVVCLAAPEDLPVVMSLSLDRFLRVHDLRNKRILRQHYLKSKPSSVLIYEELSMENFGVADDEPPLKRIKQ